MPILIGFLKGLLIGGAAGAGGFFLGELVQSGLLAYLFFGALGAVMGIVAGKPFWKHTTIWTPVLKGIFGLGLFVGLYALVAHLWNPTLMAEGLGQRPMLLGSPYVLAPLLAIVYGVFIEWDDAHDDPPPAPKKK